MGHSDTSHDQSVTASSTCRWGSSNNELAASPRVQFIPDGVSSDLEGLKNSAKLKGVVKLLSCSAEKLEYHASLIQSDSWSKGRREGGITRVGKNESKFQLFSDKIGRDVRLMVLIKKHSEKRMHSVGE